ADGPRSDSLSRNGAEGPGKELGPSAFSGVYSWPTSGPHSSTSLRYAGSSYLAGRNQLAYSGSRSPATWNDTSSPLAWADITPIPDRAPNTNTPSTGSGPMSGRFSGVLQ